MPSWMSCSAAHETVTLLLQGATHLALHFALSLIACLVIPGSVVILQHAWQVATLLLTGNPSRHKAWIKAHAKLQRVGVLPHQHALLSLIACLMIPGSNVVLQHAWQVATLLTDAFSCHNLCILCNAVWQHALLLLTSIAATAMPCALSLIACLVIPGSMVILQHAW